MQYKLLTSERKKTINTLMNEHKYMGICLLIFYRLPIYFVRNSCMCVCAKFLKVNIISDITLKFSTFS